MPNMGASYIKKTLVNPGDSASVNSTGCGSCIVQTSAGAWLNFVGSVDGGATWRPVFGKPVGQQVAPATSGSGTGPWHLDCTGFLLVGVVALALDGGPTSVIISASPATSATIDDDHALEVGGNLQTIALNTTSQSTRSGTGNITAAGAAGPTTAYQLACDGAKSVCATFSGAYTGAAVVAEGSADGLNWFSLPFFSLFPTTPTTFVSLANNSTVAYLIPTAGMTFVRVRAYLFTSGSLTASLVATDSIPYSPAFEGQYLAAGTTLGDQQWGQFLLTSAGFLKVSQGDDIAGENRSDQVLMTSPRAIASTTGAWTQYASAAKVGTVGISVKAAAGRVRQLAASNASTTVGYFLLVVDKASAPVANDLPVWSCPLPVSSATVPSGGTIDLGEAALTVSNGFSFAISTTPDKVTLAAANDCMVFARYA